MVSRYSEGQINKNGFILQILINFYNEIVDALSKAKIFKALNLPLQLFTKNC